jgi:hypothetical protein
MLEEALVSAELNYFKLVVNLDSRVPVVITLLPCTVSVCIDEPISVVALVLEIS